MPDHPLLYCFHDFIGNSHHGVPGKTDHHRPILPVLLETKHLKRLLYDRREVLVLDVGYSRPPDQSGGEYVVFITIYRSLDAVGGHQYGAWELPELPLLILPGGPIVTVEVPVLLQLGISMGGQHLTVCVDINSLALSLLQYLLQVDEVVTRDQNGLTLLMT